MPPRNPRQSDPLLHRGTLARAVLAGILLGALFAAALLGAAPARADGTVFRADGCGDRLFVSTPSGYTVLVTDGAPGVKEGDKLRGDVERIGHPVLFDDTLGRPVFAQVAELHLSKVDVASRIAVRCHTAAGATRVSGYVARASGCGSRIFVDTAQGYAVLERVAGGAVADGDTLTGNYNRPGRATVRDSQSGSDLIVFVEDLWLPKSAVDRKIAASCRR